MGITLPISRLINVTVNLAPAAAQSQSLNSLLIMGPSTVIDTVQRMRAYNSLTAVGVDFGTNAPEYLAANLWFQQNPAPNQVLIGRWVNVASSGQLICGPLVAPNTLLATWQAIVTGSFKVTIDATAQQSILNLNFTGAASLAGVAAIINAALAGATCTYDVVNNRFVFTSTTTGAASNVTFLVAGAAGTDISGKLSGLALSSGAYVAPGLIAETAVAATVILDNLYGQQWYGLMFASVALVAADHIAIGAFVEGSSTYHFYGVTTQDANVLVAGNATNVAFQLKGLYNRTAVQYSSTTPFAVASLLARILTTDWAGNRTAITLMYKQEPGIVAENLNSSQIGVLEGFNCNVFVNYNNNTAIIETGVSTTGQFIDTIVGTAALAIGIQTAIYNVLFLSTTKIPQTDAGMHILTTAVEQVCTQFVVDGLLGPGTWTAGGFGALNQGDFMQKGYYVYTPPVATQLASQRAARIATPIQVAAKLAGAVHNANVSIAINA